MNMIIYCLLKPLEPAFLPAIFIQGIISTMFFGWLPLYLPEIFPTRVRATGTGISYNFGRFLTAAGVMAAGLLIQFFNGEYAKVGTVTVNLKETIREIKKGKVEFEVKVKAKAEEKEEGKSVTIEVSDTGEGIKKEDLPFIFERFYKVSKGGLGLGLAIAKELVLAHEGTITASSEYGKGATFTVSLPNRPA
jgi:light-regulated signal transduction histidine kinase (bacteriophytochrome)